MVNMVYTIHGENKRNPHFSFFPIHRRHLLLLNMVQGDALLVRAFHFVSGIELC